MGFLASIQMSDELVAEFIRIVYHGNKHFSDSESREQKTDIRGQRARTYFFLHNKERMWIVNRGTRHLADFIVNSR
jgi:hypothetical protein